MIDITQLTPTELERFIHLQAIVDRQANNAAEVRALRAYYDGDHPVLLTQRQQEYLGKLLSEGEFVFAHNLIRTIIDTLRERLQVTGFSVNGATADDGDEGDAATAKLLWEWWTANRMNSQQNRLYKRALRDGYSYIMVDYDAAAMRPRLTLHHRDDGSEGVMLHRDPSDANRVIMANRYFSTFDPLRPGETGRQRKTTYLPHEIRKYIAGRNGGWESVQDEGDNTWPIPWRDSSGAPLGIPVMEFENPDGSEVRQVIGLQNALNKAWLDLLAAADASGFPLLAIQYTGENFGVASDDANLSGADELRFAPGRAIEVDNATVNRLAASDLSPMIDTLWAITSAIAGVSRTPQYYLRPIGGSDVPSGEALKQLESGLVKRAEERQLVFGQSWADVMQMCVKVEQTFGTQLAGVDAGNLTIATQWQDANVRNEEAESRTAAAHAALGVPEAIIWQRLGYTPEEIAGFKRERSTTRALEVAAIAQAVTAAQNVQAQQQTGIEVR